MADELTVYNGSFEEFVSSILKTDRNLTRKQIEQAGILFRGCGSLRRYIAYAICAEYNPQRLTVSDRESITGVCREHLQCSMDYALHLHRHAEIEIEVFGPFSTAPERLAQAMSREHAETIYKLPQGKRAEAWREIVSFHQINGGVIVQSNVTNIVNRRLKEIERANAPAMPSGETAQTEVAPNFKSETIKAAKAEPSTETPIGAINAVVDDEEDPDDYDATAILAEPETLNLSDAIEGETVTVEATETGLQVIIPSMRTVQLSPDYCRKVDTFRAYFGLNGAPESEVLEKIIDGFYEIRKARLSKYETISE